MLCLFSIERSREEDLGFRNMGSTSSRRLGDDNAVWRVRFENCTTSRRMRGKTEAKVVLDIDVVVSFDVEIEETER